MQKINDDQLDKLYLSFSNENSELITSVKSASEKVMTCGKIIVSMLVSYMLMMILIFTVFTNLWVFSLTVTTIAALLIIGVCYRTIIISNKLVNEYNDRWENYRLHAHKEV